MDYLEDKYLIQVRMLNLKEASLIRESPSLHKQLLASILELVYRLQIGPLTSCNLVVR